MDQIDFLLVEDNDLDAVMIERILRREKLVNSYKRLKNGVEALEYINNQAVALPRFVLLDIKLPKVSGLEVLKQIKATEETKNLPIIMFSSSQEEKDLAVAYDYGANSYIVKPVEFSVLKETIRGITRYWLTLNKNVG